MRSPVSVVLCTLLILVMAPTAHGAITFEFNYTDFPGVGFNDPTAGPARRAALEQAAQVFGSSAFGGYNATIVMDASGTAPPLATAGSNDLQSDDFSGGGFGRLETVRNKILSNGATDLNGPDSDGSVSWNFDQTMWELDINTTPAGGNFDFYSTVYHELVHALGWLDTADAATGADSFGGGLSGGDPGEWNMYDQFLSDRTGTRSLTVLPSSTTTQRASPARPSAAPALASPEASSSRDRTPWRPMVAARWDCIPRRSSRKAAASVTLTMKILPWRD